MTSETSSGFPADDKARQDYLIHDYLFGYFPDAFLAELEVAIEGNKQHNPGERLHWAREKSTDHLNKAMRHIWLHGRGEKKDDGGKTWHLAKAIWRIKAQLQLEIEEERTAAKKAVHPVIRHGAGGIGFGEAAPHRCGYQWKCEDTPEKK